jgi:hypothetical protein
MKKLLKVSAFFFCTGILFAGAHDVKAEACASQQQSVEFSCNSTAGGGPNSAECQTASNQLAACVQSSNAQSPPASSAYFTLSGQQLYPCGAAVAARPCVAGPGISEQGP